MPDCSITTANIYPAGDCAILVVFGDQINIHTNRRVHQYARAAVSQALPGVGECVPGYASLLIHYDPLLQSYQDIQQWLLGLEPEQNVVEDAVRRVHIPVVYGGEDGPDLDFVASHHGITENEVVQIHSTGEYRVYMMGFMPGFPYLGGMDPAIGAPRLNTPREFVRAGSVGIAGEQTGIYPFDSPGGWRIIGRALVNLFDLTRDPPFLLSPGDVVVFDPVLPGDA